MSYTAVVGTNAGLAVVSLGILMTIIFMSAVFNKGKRFLNNTDILSIAVVGVEGLVGLIGLTTNLTVLLNGYVMTPGLFCSIEGAFLNFFSGCYNALHFGLAVDRYIHTRTSEQATSKTLLLAVLIPIAFNLVMMISLLATGDGFAVTPAGFICIVKLTSQGDNILPRILSGIYTGFNLIIFNVTATMYFQMYMKLKEVGKNMAGDKKTESGNAMLMKLLYRCIGMATGLCGCWGPVLLKCAYSVISNQEIPPGLDVFVTVLAVCDPVIIQGTLLLMNRAYWKAIEDTFLKISRATTETTRKMSSAVHRGSVLGRQSVIGKPSQMLSVNRTIGIKSTNSTQ